MKQTYFNSTASTANSHLRSFCYSARPCKKVAFCDNCAENHKEYFSFMGSMFCAEKGIDTFFTLSWPHGNNSPVYGVEWGPEDKVVWEYRRDLEKSLKLCSRYLSSYLRVIAIGDKKETLHTHILLRSDELADFKEAIGRLVLQKTPTPHDEPITNVSHLLGYYIFQKNYLPTLCRTDRPSGTRLLTSSRGFACGYPRGQWLKEFKTKYAAYLIPISNENDCTLSSTKSAEFDHLHEGESL